MTVAAVVVLVPCPGWGVCSVAGGVFSALVLFCSS